MLENIAIGPWKTGAMSPAQANYVCSTRTDDRDRMRRRMHVALDRNYHHALVEAGDGPVMQCVTFGCVRIANKTRVRLKQMDHTQIFLQIIDSL